MKKNNGYNIWIANAQKDMETAELLFEANHYTSIICFHVHQAIEKALKGYLVFNNAPPRRIHHLEELLKNCSKFNKAFLDYCDECLKISAYYIESRYPLDMPKEYTRSETKDAIHTATRILKLVNSQIF